MSAITAPVSFAKPIYDSPELLEIQLEEYIKCYLTTKYIKLSSVIDVYEKLISSDIYDDVYYTEEILDNIQKKLSKKYKIFIDIVYQDIYDNFDDDDEPIRHIHLDYIWVNKYEPFHPDRKAEKAFSTVSNILFNSDNDE